MDKYIYNEKNGLWYELQGDYYIPCLGITRRKRRKAYRRMGTAAFAVYLQCHACLSQQIDCTRQIYGHR